jgi:hypothetical protein
LIEASHYGNNFLAGPYFTLGTTGTVPRAYEGIEGRKKIKIKHRKM